MNEFIAKDKLPDPPNGAKAIKWQHNAQRNDWYVETKEGWFYFISGEWKHCPMGPIEA